MSDLSQPDNDPSDNQKIGLSSIGIPGEALVNPFLSSTEKILFGFIRSLSKKTRGCWAKNSYLGQLIGVHKTNVSSLLATLRNYGYIRIEQIKKRDGTFERRMYERTEYPELYESLVTIFHDYLLSGYSSPLIKLLEDEVKSICSPQDPKHPEKFDPDKGFVDFDKKLEEAGGSVKRLRAISEKTDPLYDKGKDKDRIVSKDTISDSNESPLKNLSNRFQRLAPIPLPEETVSIKKVLPDYIKPKTWEFAVLNAWNNLPKFMKVHLHDKRNTKTVKHIKEYLNQMKNGVFGEPSRRQWDGNWAGFHKIDMRKFAEKKWTPREIIQTLTVPFVDLYRDGYEPQDKATLPKSFTDALYNPRTHKSFFVRAYYAPPGPIKLQMKDPYPDITENLTQKGILDPKQMKAQDWKQYYDGVKGIAKHLEEIDWGNYGARQMFGVGKVKTPYLLIMQYVKWMQGMNTALLAPSKIPDRWHFGMIRPDFWMWRKFMEAVNRYWGRVFGSVESEED